MVYGGRGGAGNVLPKRISHAQMQKNADLEAQRVDSDTVSVISTPAHDVGHSDLRPYAYKGRGGAGNLYSPRDLNETGTFQGAESSHILGDGTPAPASEQSHRVTSNGNVEPRIHAPLGIEDFPALMKTTSATRPFRGIGGAGNYASGSAEAEDKAARKKAESEERKKEKIRTEIERDVEAGLRRPDQVKVTGEERF
ncbi:hypothetical protein M8818_002878 [Zalaria obscura]|uniref:Uncharacterized protein n=1 Tax=Zalaria obscura TaxID=2024903 RepID=A0ACC3SHR1_9PEZI